MKKFFCTIFSLMVLFSVSAKAEWIPLLKEKLHNSPPEVKLLKHSNDFTLIEVKLPGFNLESFTAEGKLYHHIDILDEIYTNEPGKPELPYIAKILAIPDSSAVSVEVLNIGKEYTFTDINLPPARESWWEGDPEPPYIENQQTYLSRADYPGIIAQTDIPSVFRDFRITRVAIYPFQYIPSEKVLKVYSSITIKVTYGAGLVINPKMTPKRKIAPSFGAIYRSSIFNYQEVLDQNYRGQEDGIDLMLCIMPDALYNSFQVYADWKRKSGIDIRMTKFSQINANATNPDIIKNHITQAYNTWPNPPTYVLIIGDNGVFPKKIVTYPGYSFPWEEYFVCVAGNDYFPEMMIGRFTNEGDYRMQVMINKFMKYEKQPYTANSTWFRKATMCSNNEYQSQVETKRFVKNVLIQDGNFLQVDTMMSNGNSWGGGCTYNLTHIKNAINEGRSFLNYRGEGWYYGWYANCYDFYTNDVTSLNNGEKLTFVTSIGCGVAMFDSQGSNCFGEEWIEMGTLSAPKGGIAFIGPTSNTHTTYNNRIDKGIYVGMFREDMETPGQALARGKLYMYNVFGNEYYVEYHYKVFCVLGDPSVHIWKITPLAITVNYPSVISVGYNQIEVQVNFSVTGFPANKAQVTITGPDLFLTTYTNASGKAIIETTLSSQEVLNLTVRGYNVIPFQGTLQVIQPDVLVEPAAPPIITDLNYNQDGKINPNEICNVVYTLKNWGSTTAYNVQAILTSPDNFVEILTTSPINFGNINSIAQVTGNPFQFHVKPECPIGHELNFNLQITASNNYSWNYPLKVPVKGCQLTFENFVIHDYSATLPNFRLEPGETAAMVIKIRNYGEDVAPDVIATLSSFDPYISILDSQGVFGTLAIGQSITNPENYFVIQTSVNTPQNYAVPLTINLSTQNGFYPYSETVNFELPVSKLIPKDYSGPDTYGYYAYSSDDTFYDETPQYNWVEIIQTGTQINLPSISDYTVPINLPFTFRYYGKNYNKVRVSTDGWIAFGEGNQTAPINTVLPNPDNINNMVAVLWDDLYDTEFYMGKIFHYYDQPGHRFIIEWDSISHNNFISEPIREVFQVILLDPLHHSTMTGDGEIIMQYKIIQQPETVTVGIENDSQTIGLQYLFDNQYDATATPLINGLAIKFTTDPPFQNLIVSTKDNFHQKSSDHISCYPNPFRNTTTIKFHASDPSNTTLFITDLSGRVVKHLQKSYLESGLHEIQWDGTNDQGIRLQSGMYFLMYQTEKISGSLKIILLDR